MTTVLAVRDALDEAVRVLAGGGLAAIPTETVYGLAADATNGAAVARIFEVKGRPRFNPLICHVGDFAMAERHGEFDALSRRLAERFWPGPLTLVVPLKPGSPVHPLVTAGGETVALRMPRGFAADLIARLDRPLAAPSANTSGRISPTTAEAVARDLGGRIDLIVDAGPCAVGLESTIAKVEDGTIRILRPGGVPAGEIAAAAGVAVRAAESDAAIEAPGMLASHYAPHAAVRLDASRVGPDEALLAFGPHRAEGAAQARLCLNLSPAGNLREAAANLFSHLGRLDRPDVAAIAVEPVPHEGLGVAINDRLARAAAPRG